MPVPGKLLSISIPDMAGNRGVTIKMTDWYGLKTSKMNPWDGPIEIGWAQS